MKRMNHKRRQPANLEHAALTRQRHRAKHQLGQALVAQAQSPQGRAKVAVEPHATVALVHRKHAHTLPLPAAAAASRGAAPRAPVPLIAFFRL
jgi:hypothetical protein